MKTTWKLIRETYLECRKDKALRLGAALSFYTVLSLPALLVITISFGGAFFGEQQARDEVVDQVRELVGDSGADTVETVLEDTDLTRERLGSALVGVGILLFAATTVFSQLQAAMNTIWGIETPPRRRFLLTLKRRLLSFVMVIVIGLILLLMLIVSALIPVLGGLLDESTAGLQNTLHVTNTFVSIAILTALFALSYKYLPDAEVAWRDVWLRALVAALLFTFGKFIIGVYLGRSDIVSAYGASSSLVFFLLWIYYSSQIFFLGAEFTEVYAISKGRGPASSIGPPAS